MANLGTAVRSYLIANAGVYALVGDRIYPDVLPQSRDVGGTITPFNIFTQGAAIEYHGGPARYEHMLNGLSGVVHQRIEFTAYAASRLAADAIADAVRKSGLPGYIGTMGGIPIESVNLISDMQRFVEPPTDGTQRYRYLTVFDYEFCYQES